VNILQDRSKTPTLLSRFYLARTEVIDTNYGTLINAVLRDYARRSTTANDTNLRTLIREIVREELSRAM
jgi:hypothetical protein